MFKLIDFLFRIISFHILILIRQLSLIVNLVLSVRCIDTVSFRLFVRIIYFFSFPLKNFFR